jgi:1,4-dihydroxy-2-naphthoyl-CoA hydrolase
VDEHLTAVGERLRSGETLDPADLGLFAFDDDVFGTATLGLAWDGLALDRVTAHLDCDERHHQPYGIVHGGVWCAVVESLASVGAALRAVAAGGVVVGVSNSTDFLRAHRTGRVDAVAEPLHVGRTQQLWQVVLTRADDGKVVARGQVRLQQLPADRALAGRAPGAPADGASS